ncbi:MAM and LDL-receptor class A domain-containing protein 2-like isoform X2 [Montipora capricornis]|uniref:MAM and LDL-receptor class A domain-containing protein 2-like isoform X2 n=1 Tax=Montipora capricornis TaxID=246305 RepID=UPI0035F1705E
MSAFSRMEVLLATLVFILASLTHGGPISNIADDPDASATEVIYKINQEEDVEPQLFEGDILLGADNNGVIEDGGMPREKRNARRLRHYIWKAKIIPYEISTQLIQEGYDSTILSAIEEFSKHTCIQWKPRTDEDQWVIFVKKSGCYSSVGVNYWRSGSQDISLGNGCNHKGVVMHEMMHAAGFWHEQSRYDRDKYIEIFWENIQPGKEHNFNKYTLREIDYLNEVYDTSSLMHYGKTSFSSNNKPTIQVIGDPNKQLGQRNGFSNTDIAQLNALYDCSGPSGGWSSWSSFGPCDDQCVHYRQRFCSSRDLNNCPEADRYGIETDVQKCSDEKCFAPVDGHWGRWSSWSSCSVTCDQGEHSRTRICNDPVPKNGGKDCPGNSSDVGGCRNKRCGLGPNDCEFEAGGMCHWTSCQQSYCCPYWKLNTGATRSPGTGPQGDHTSGSGNYLYFEASSPAQPGQTSCFSSKLFPAGSCQLLTFWYHMLGRGIGELRVMVSGSVVWRKSGEQGDKWIQASVEIQSDQEFQITFEGVRGPDYRGDIAVDDISFKDCKVPTATVPPTTTQPTTTEPTTTQPTTTQPTTTQPTTTQPTTTQPTTTQPTTTQPTTTQPTTTQPTTTQLPPSTSPPTVSPGTGPNDCEFEAGGMCHWTSCQQSYCCPYWKLNTGATRSPGTGPQGDHTSGSGNYLYFEASSPAQPGQTSCFSSKLFPAGSCQLLTFWYHMLGRGIGELRVMVSGSVVWRKSGEQGDKWIQASVEIQSDQEFQITFEGVRGPDYRGDIAVDDISFKDCKVPTATVPPTTTQPTTTEPTTTQPTTTQPTTTQPTTTQPTTTQPTTTQPTTTQLPPSTSPPTVSPGTGLDSCDFDNGNLCDWANNAGTNPTNYTWVVHSGTTPTGGTGPSGDHSANGQGGYIYLDASNAADGETAQLISKQFSGASASCLHFWYHMYGSRLGMGTLRVYLQRKVKKGLILRQWELWEKTRNRGKKWQNKKITIKKHKKNLAFQLIFEGTRGSSEKGDIALDDIKVVAGACSSRRRKRKRT